MGKKKDKPIDVNNMTPDEKLKFEVAEEIGSVIVESRRLEDNLARKERYHCYSMDAVDFEGSGYAGKDTPESLLEQTADKRHIKGLLE